MNRKLFTLLLLLSVQGINAAMLQDILEFDTKNQFHEFSNEVDRLCSEQKLELIDLPELLDQEPGGEMPPVRFYKELKTGTIWMLKLPQDSFKGSFAVLPKKRKVERMHIDTKSLYEELMLVWKKVVGVSLLIVFGALAIYYFVNRG